MGINNKPPTYFSHSWAAISPHCLNALGIEGRLLLVQAFVGKADIALLGLKDARHVYLGGGRRGTDDQTGDSKNGNGIDSEHRNTL